MAISILMVLFN